MGELLREMPSEETLEAFVRGMVHGHQTVIFDMDTGKFIDRSPDVICSDTE